MRSTKDKLCDVGQKNISLYRVDVQGGQNQPFGRRRWPFTSSHYSIDWRGQSRKTCYVARTVTMRQAVGSQQKGRSRATRWILPKDIECVLLLDVISLEVHGADNKIRRGKSGRVLHLRLHLLLHLRPTLPAFDTWDTCRPQRLSSCARICNICRTPILAKSKTYTIKRHKCFRKQRRFSRESTSCCFSVGTVLFPGTIVHFYSYTIYILQHAGRLCLDRVIWKVRVSIEFQLQRLTYTNTNTRCSMQIDKRNPKCVYLGAFPL